MVLGIVCAMLTAAIFGLVALRSEGVGFIIITIALNEIVWGLAYQWVSVSGGDNGITGIVRPHVGPFDVSANTGYYYVCLACFAISLVLLLVIVRSPFGLVLKGVRETPRRMRALGYNVWLYRYFAMMISGGFAGARRRAVRLVQPVRRAGRALARPVDADPHHRDPGRDRNAVRAGLRRARRRVPQQRAQRGDAALGDGARRRSTSRW